MSQFSPVKVSATIPQSRSAIQMAGDGCRITFEIPEVDKIKVLPIIAMQSMVLKLTIEVDSRYHPNARPGQSDSCEDT